jgi:hypothetical protein
MTRTCRTGILAVVLAVAAPASAQEALLAEDFKPGHAYRIEGQSKLTGKIAATVEKGKPPQVLDVVGASRVVADERVLAADEPGVVAVVRSYRDIQFKRTMGGVQQDTSVRPSVRRMVVRAANGKNVPFSPDGPLMVGEIDFVKADTFSPTIVPGLLPGRGVRVGDTWKASAAATAELTGMEKVESGDLTAEFLGVTEVDRKRVAKIKVAGVLRGVDQDGPGRLKLDGTAYFDLDAKMLTYLSVKGTHEMLDGNGQVMGLYEGLSVTTRTPLTLPADLSDASLRGLELKPNIENTQLLFDNPGLGARFLYPRGWRVGAIQGKQVKLDHSAGGAHILITVEPPGKVPTAEDYQRETVADLKKDNAEVREQQKPTRVRSDPVTLDRFSVDARFGADKPVRVESAVLRQTEGGATVAATLSAAAVTDLTGDVERIIRSLAVTKKIEEK